MAEAGINNAVNASTVKFNSSYLHGMGTSITPSVTKLKVFCQLICILLCRVNHLINDLNKSVLSFGVHQELQTVLKAFVHYKNIDCDCGINIGNMENGPNVLCTYCAMVA